MGQLLQELLRFAQEPSAWVLRPGMLWTCGGAPRSPPCLLLRYPLFPAVPRTTWHASGTAVLDGTVGPHSRWVVHVCSARRQLRLGAGVWGSIPLAPFLVLASAALALRFVALVLGSTTSGNATARATRRESIMSKMRKSLEAVLMVAAAVAEGSAAGLLLPV